MNITINKAFIRDLKKISDKELLGNVKKAVNNFEAIDNLSKMSNVKKLKNTDFLYRLKIKNYRLGFEYIDNNVTLLRFLHRKDIYKHFP